MHYTWPGNVRQLKNIAEQLSVIEQAREIDAATLRNYLPDGGAATTLPALAGATAKGGVPERELFLKLLFDVKSELDQVKNELSSLRQGGPVAAPLVAPAYHEEIRMPLPQMPAGTMSIQMPTRATDGGHQDVEHAEVEESLSLMDKEKELIQKALVKHRNKRKGAARELGISERTLYRKIKEYEIQ